MKKRWKHLKDQYRKELKKQPIHRSGDEADDWESTWQYFTMMSFVKDEIMPAPSTGNLSALNTQTDSTQETENTDVQNDILHDSEVELIATAATSLSPQPSLPTSSSSQVSAKKRTTIREHMLEIERKKLILMEKRLTESDNTNLNHDEDFLFFKSILPCMKKLTDLQRFQLRGKVNEWLIEAMTENERIFYQNQGYFSNPGVSGRNNERNYEIQPANEFPSITHLE